MDPATSSPHRLARRSLSEPGPLAESVAASAPRAPAAAAPTVHPAAAGRCPFFASSEEPAAAAAAAAAGPSSPRPSACPFASPTTAAGPSPPEASWAPQQQQQQKQQRPPPPPAAAWQSRLRRPTLAPGDARASRRALRAQNRAFSLGELAEHRYADDGWIAVDGRVYDVTEHVLAHKGWRTGCGMTEVLSILAHLGGDCSAEFREIHACYPAAFAQLRAYDIGPLMADGEEEEGKA
jgi:hypothetical protein